VDSRRTTGRTNPSSPSESALIDLNVATAWLMGPVPAEFRDVVAGQLLRDPAIRLAFAHKVRCSAADVPVKSDAAPGPPISIDRCTQASHADDTRAPRHS
jgi:hypothetical protein